MIHVDHYIPSKNVYHSGAAVLAGDGDPEAIGTERHRVHRALMIHVDHYIPAGHIRHPDAAVLASGGDPGAIRAECHRIHRATVVEAATLDRRRPDRISDSDVTLNCWLKPKRLDC